MDIQEKIQKELDKINCADGLNIDTIRLSSDLGRKVIENVIKNFKAQYEANKKK